MKVSIHLQRRLQFISCKKVPQNDQVAIFHGCDSIVPPQGPKMPFHHTTPPNILPLILSLHPYSHALKKSEAFHMLGTKIYSQKCQIFYCRVQYRVLHHKLYAGSHELWCHADNYGFLSSWLGLKQFRYLFCLYMLVWRNEGTVEISIISSIDWYLAHNVQEVHCIWKINTEMKQVLNGKLFLTNQLGEGI